MTPPEFEEILARTLDDGRLSRSERKAIQARLETDGADEQLRSQLRAMAFDKARDVMRDSRDGAVVEWLEDMVKSLLPPGDPRPVPAPEAYFSPGDGCRERVVSLLGACRDRVDVCVFTITDDRITDALVEAHRRGVRVRVITDNEKALDLGSDIDRLERAGIPVRVDHTPDHMHHKFAVFDGQRLVTGSYNWTRSASAANWENIIVLGEPPLIARFQEVFETLWTRL